MSGRLRSVGAGMAVLALFGGVALGVACGDKGSSAVRVAPPAPVASSSSVAPQPGAPSSAPARPVAAPTHVRIASIGVDAAVIRLGLNPDGTLETPTDFAQTGWWSGGHRAGEVGPAVIVGHVDNKSGPAVFYRLRDLRRGDTIEVDRGTDGPASFAVERVEEYPKTAFPTDAVYGPTDRPTLRLVTCGGSFDHSIGHYRDNIVVYATQVGT